MNKQIKIFLNKHLGVTLMTWMFLVAMTLITMGFEANWKTSVIWAPWFKVYKNLEHLNIVKDTFKADWNTITNAWWKENVEDLANGWIKVFYPAGSYKPSASPKGWAGFIKHFSYKKDDSKLTYDIKFDENFDFVKWGKLPWFCGGTCPRWGSSATDWFSTRFMWRTNWDLEVYAYLPWKNWIYGQSIGRGMYRFIPGQTYKISQEIIMNQPGKNNWSLIVYVDWNEVFRDNNMNFRLDRNLKPNKLLFSTFFGWGDPSWATPNDTNIYFSNFKIEY